MRPAAAAAAAGAVGQARVRGAAAAIVAARPACAVSDLMERGVLRQGNALRQRVAVLSFSARVTLIEALSACLLARTLSPAPRLRPALTPPPPQAPAACASSSCCCLPTNPPLAVCAAAADTPHGPALLPPNPVRETPTAAPAACCARRSQQPPLPAATMQLHYEKTGLEPASKLLAQLHLLRHAQCRVHQAVQDARDREHTANDRTKSGQKLVQRLPRLAHHHLRACVRAAQPGNACEVSGLALRPARTCMARRLMQGRSMHVARH